MIQHVKMGPKEDGWYAIAVRKSEVKMGMDIARFDGGLPSTRGGKETIWVIEDSLTKLAHFLPIKKCDITKFIIRLYVKKIGRMYGNLVTIVSDRDLIFMSCFFRGMQSAMRTKLNMSVEYHFSQTLLDIL